MLKECHKVLGELQGNEHLATIPHTLCAISLALETANLHTWRPSGTQLGFLQHVNKARTKVTQQRCLLQQSLGEGPLKSEQFHEATFNRNFRDRTKQGYFSQLYRALCAKEQQLMVKY